MNAHEKFLNLSTIGVNLIDLQTADPAKKLGVIRELSKKCNDHVKSTDPLNINVLETHRMILCHEYKLSVALRKIEHSLESTDDTYVDLAKFFVIRSPTAEEFSLLYDIAVLRLTLHSNEQQFLQTFKDFHAMQSENLRTKEKSKNLCMRVYGCLIDACSLRLRLYGEEKKDFEQLRKCVLETIASWMNQDEKLEWRLLVSLLPKLICVFGTQNVVAPLWNKVLADCDELGKTLATLCVMADFCFPCEENHIHETHYERCMDEEFWLILQRGLESKIYQERKQALYLAKRALDFIESHEVSVRKAPKPSKNNIVPFVFGDSTPQEPLVDSSKTNYFLVLEVLEEKQKQLVLPTLSHLPNLVKAYTALKTRNNGFNVAWLQCIFKRILQHDSNALKLLGLREILQADLDIYDEDFINFITNSLNNTLLYEYDEISEKEPTIVRHLEDFFIRCENSKLRLMNTFFRSISRLSWCPVAIYWILRALVIVTEQRKIVHNTWTREELKCVKILTEKILRMHSKILRLNCQMLILQMFCAYTRPSADWSDVELVLGALICHTDFVLLGEWTEYYKVTEHLSTIVKQIDAQSYVVRISQKLEEVSTEPCALAIGLLIESHLICTTRDCPAEKALAEKFQCLIGADLRPYADTSYILKIISLVCSLIDVSFVLGFESKRTTERLVVPYGDDIVKIIDKSFMKIDSTSFNVYANALRTLSNYTLPRYPDDENGVPWWRDRSSGLERFADKCVNIILNSRQYTRTQCAYAVKMLYTSCEEACFHRIKIDESYVTSLMNYLDNEILGCSDNDDSSIDEGRRKFSVDSCDNIARLLHLYVTRTSPEIWTTDVRWLEKLLILVENGSEDIISSVAETLYDLHHKYRNWSSRDLDNVKSIICLAWSNISQLKRTPIYFSAVEKLTHEIVDPEFLELDGAYEFAIDCVDQMMKEGETVPSLKNIFVGDVYTMLPEDVVRFKKALVSCLLHGPVPRRDQRIEQATVSNCTSTFCMDRNMDNKVRAQSIVSLLVMLDKSRGNQCIIRSVLLSELVAILVKNRNKRYFENSHLHKIKHRVMQTLLIIEPYLDKKETQILHDTVCNLLITESNQTSVRLMQEWLIVRIYAKHSISRENIWILFEMANDQRPGSIVSIASVIFHLSRLFEDETIVEFISDAMKYLLPNCMSQQFNVRLYCQAILVKLYEMLPQDTPEAKDQRGIYEAVKESLCRGNITKNSIKLFDDFYFKIFHPIYDYNLQTIYHEMPRLTGLSADELITTEVFIDLWPFDYQDVITISMSDEEINDAWEAMKPTRQSSRATGDLGDDNNTSFEEGLCDVQKKIIPWKSMLPLNEELTDITRFAGSTTETKNHDKGIIVVASLIDRPPNLGGLARTCEIFGAKELVIGTLKYAEDREFQSLSVSAEKWITITEVKPHLLQNYLIEKRTDGWKLVGAEQTANSTNLVDMKFDEKTILLLGNEKDGIPGNLIPILDTCVEIPQSGVVRSLNVHVTGAICIWQYATQHFHS